VLLNSSREIISGPFRLSKVKLTSISGEIIDNYDVKQGKTKIRDSE
jgi:hypothetical protein